MSYSPTGKAEVIANLEMARVKAGLSSKDISDILEITPSYLSHMRRQTQLSKNMSEPIIELTAALIEECRISKAPIFIQEVPETSSDSKIRKRKLLKAFCIKYGLTSSKL